MEETLPAIPEEPPGLPRVAHSLPHANAPPATHQLPWQCRSKSASLPSASPPTHLEVDKAVLTTTPSHPLPPLPTPERVIGMWQRIHPSFRVALLALLRTCIKNATIEYEMAIIRAAEILQSRQLPKEDLATVVYHSMCLLDRLEDAEAKRELNRSSTPRASHGGHGTPALPTGEGHGHGGHDGEGEREPAAKDLWRAFECLYLSFCLIEDEQISARSFIWPLRYCSEALRRIEGESGGGAGAARASGGATASPNRLCCQTRRLAEVFNRDIAQLLALLNYRVLVPASQLQRARRRVEGLVNLGRASTSPSPSPSPISKRRASFIGNVVARGTQTDNEGEAASPIHSDEGKQLVVSRSVSSTESVSTPFFPSLPRPLPIHPIHHRASIDTLADLDGSTPDNLRPPIPSDLEGASSQNSNSSISTSLDYWWANRPSKPQNPPGMPEMRRIYSEAAMLGRDSDDRETPLARLMAGVSPDVSIGTAASLPSQPTTYTHTHTHTRTRSLAGEHPVHPVHQLEASDGGGGGGGDEKLHSRGGSWWSRSDGDEEGFGEEDIYCCDPIGFI